MPVSTVSKIRVKGVYYDLIRQFKNTSSTEISSMTDSSTLMKKMTDEENNNVYISSHSDIIKMAGVEKTLSNVISFESSTEHAYVVTDSNDKIIFGIKTNGDVFFGVGVPQQIIDYVTEQISQSSVEGYEDIQNFLDEIQYGQSTLYELLGNKVDVDGSKVLSDVNYSIADKHKVDNISSFMNWLGIGIDSERGVLEICGKQYKLIEYEGDADIEQFYDYQTLVASITNVENNEFSKVILDKDDKILYGKQNDNTEYTPDLTGYSVEDSSGKIISASTIVNNLK